MVSKIERLLEQLAHLQGDRGKVGPDHPGFKKWLADARSYLRHRGRPSEIRRFEQIGFVRARPRMWRKEESTPAEFRDFRADLERARCLLEDVRDTEALAARKAPPHSPRVAMRT